MVMERGRRNVNNLPLLTHIKSEITKRLCRDGVHEKKYRPHTGKYAELTQTDACAFFLLFFFLIYDSVRTVDSISHLYIETIAVFHKT